MLVDKKRLNFVIILIMLLFLGAFGKLFFLQVVENNKLIHEVTRQRNIDTLIKPVRGNIYDRNMIPFTETEEKTYAVVIPNYFSDFKSVSMLLSKYTDYTQEQIERKLVGQKPVTFVLNHSYNDSLKAKLQVPGVEIFKSEGRYGEHSLARHIIGYINTEENIGYSGIEKAFNHYLATNEYQTIGMIGDASKRPIPGLGYRITECLNENTRNHVRLTLDYHIQKIVEDVMDEQVESGAVIVTEINTGNIAAIASRPNYSQEHIKDYINSTGDQLINKAFSAYDAGSIFKIVVAAAALENKVVSPDSPFYCGGYIDIEGMPFACHKIDGHGDLNFFQGFIHSCNPVFIQTGLNIGYDHIVKMANKFGFGSVIELYDDVQQHSGNIPEKEYISAREIANISIGQGEILVTPIQVADMVTTIANNGVRKKLNLVEAIVTDEGNIVKLIRSESDSRVISEETAVQIQRMMHETTISGTGKNANLEEYGGAGGKTGSAETGWVVNGETKVHAWFAGFFPAVNPKYSIVVFVENGRQGGGAAAPVFKAIAEKIIQLNR